MPYKAHQRGFTLSELIVVVAIISLFTVTFLLMSQNSQGRIVLTNIAHDAALLVRSAQTLGSNGRLHSSQVFPYGVKVSPQSREMDLYIDTDTSLSYSAGDVVMNSFTTPSPEVTISSFCTYDQRGASADCYTDTAYQLDVVYLRPDVEPFISVTDINGDVNSGFYEAEIKLDNGRGGEASIFIASTGVIYVED